MDGIEVIRGPQGTLFGRNTTAGIIKVDSRRPTEETEGYFKAALGNLGTVNAEGAVGGTLVEGKLTGRVSLMTQNRSDWVDNGFTGENDVMGGYDVFAGRVQLLWTPTDNFEAWLMHQRQDQGGNSASLFRANIFDQGSNNLNGNYSRDTVFFDGGANNPAQIKSSGTTLRLDWDFDEHTLTSITSYQNVYDRFARADIDGGFGCVFTCGAGPAGPPSSPFNPFASPFAVNIDTGSNVELDQLTQELRLTSNREGALNYQVGVFYFEDDFDGSSSSQNAGATTFAPTSASSIENTTWAVFGQGSYHVTDRVTITAGVRYTDDEKDALHTDFSGTIPSVPIRLQDDNVSWDVAVSFAANDETHFYGRLASGFRAPTIQDRIQDDVEVTTADSETIQSYELGYKAQYERFRFNVAAFYYEVDDMQLTAVGGANNAVRLLNAEQGVGYGVELEFDFAATENLVLSGGYGYNETEINAPGLATAPCGSGLCTVLDAIDINGNALIDGNPFQHAPKWTLNLEVDYTFPLSSGNEFYFFTDWKFKGETSDFLYQSIEYTFDTQFEGGLRLGYRNLERDFELGLFARNLTDEDNPIGGIDFANNTGYVNQPRVWGVEGSVRF